MNSNEKSLKRRDALAYCRTELSNERTLLAYFRTAFSMIILGVGLIKLFQDARIVVLLGMFSIIFGLVVLILGFFQFNYYKKKLERSRG